MEHRHGQRIPLNVEVMIQSRPRLRSPGCVVNASVSGALVATSVHLPLHGFVQLQYITRDQDVTSVHHIDAFVVRRARGMMALVWGQVGEPEVIVLLRKNHATADLQTGTVPPVLTNPVAGLLR